MTRFSTNFLLAGISVSTLAVAALTISPTSHDFGEVPVRGVLEKTFIATNRPGTGQGIALSFTIAGPDASDFKVIEPVGGPYLCPPTCDRLVWFIPNSLGPKSATLIATDSRGNRATAALKGTGVLAICTHTVVPCNYALHYSGVVSWSDGNAGVNVDVVNGVASCNATGESELTSGPGLVAVEFGRSEEAPSPFYRITVACPTRYPPEPARPAELGHGELGSYKQPLGMTIADVNKGPPRLKGDDGEVSWNLCPNAQYVRAVRQGPQATVGPHQPCPDPARRAP